MPDEAPESDTASDEAPDTTEPDANQTPDEAPEADNASDEAPDMSISDSAANEPTNISAAASEDRNRIINRAEQNRYKAKKHEAKARRRRAKVAARNTGKAFLIKLLAATLGIVVVGGISLKVIFPGLLSSFTGSGDDVNAYSRAYISVLSLYEEDIREYDWQYSGYSASEAEGEGTSGRNTRPVALYDIDGDGIPELFFMASVYDEAPNEKCADLHIFTFKNNSLQEVSYYSEYPNEYPAEYYDGWYGHNMVRHDGRMVHYGSFEPNTSFTVFTGKEDNELYILSANVGSETRDYRMRKYALTYNLMDITSDTFEVETINGIIHSENPDEEVSSAIADMDEIVIYGGYGAGLGMPDASSGEINADADAEVYGWKDVRGHYGDNADIAPEMFQSSLCISYDEAVDRLKTQISDNKKSVEDSQEEYIPIRYDENTHQAGDMLFKYDIDTDEIRYIRIGESEVKVLSKEFFRGTDNPYTNGNSILYFDRSAGEDRAFDESYAVSLERYDLETGETETIHEFENPPDPNAGHYLGAVYDGIAYVGYDGGDNPPLWACNLANGEITEMQEHVYIKDSYGKYVLTSEYMSLSAVDYLQTDVYELKGDKLEHVADLGNRVCNSWRLINGNIYYSAIGEGDKLTTYKYDLSDGNIEPLIRFVNSDVSVSDYSEAYCLYYNNFELYKGTYKTEHSYWIPRNGW